MNQFSLHTMDPGPAVHAQTRDFRYFDRSKQFEHNRDRFSHCRFYYSLQYFHENKSLKYTRRKKTEVVNYLNSNFPVPGLQYYCACTFR